jgi:hypothetical protein
MLPGDQVFSTIPLPNLTQPIYGLAIIAPNSGGTPIASYTFPLTPSSVRKEFVSKANAFSVAGSAQQNGVQRLIDFYGIEPVVYTLEGTTGWQYHSADAFALTGMQSVLAIQNLVEQYAQLNVAQAQSNQPLYTLEFYDYFTNEFWQVVPIGRQGIFQSERRPLLYEYYFRLYGVQNLAAPPVTVLQDPIAADFSIGASQATATLSASINVSLSSYAGFTPGGLATIGLAV